MNPADTVAPQQSAVVEDIRIDAKDGEVSGRVETTRKVTYSLYQQQDPLRLVLELPRTSTGDFDRNIPVNRGNVSFIKPVPTSRGDSHLVFFPSQ